MAKDKKKKNILRRKLFGYVFTVTTTIVLMIGVLYWMQTQGQAEYQKKMSLVPLLDEVTDELDSHTESIDALTKRFHSANQISTRLVALFLQSGAFKELQTATDNLSAAKALRELTANTGLYSMMIVDIGGNLLLMDNVDAYNSSLSVNLTQYNLIKSVDNPLGVFTLTQFEQLTANVAGWEGTYKVLPDGRKLYSPVQTTIQTSDGASYHGYYYGTPIKGEDGQATGYYLIAMADATQMEADIEGLTNVGDVLDSLEVGQGGFLFSVDPETGKFSYFKNADGLVLTGKHYVDTGLSDEALVDGYSGIQEIRGVKYYCVTKVYSSDVFGYKIFIAASIPETELYGSRIYNVFWGVLAMLVIGNLVTAYAIIIQVDQIRKGTVNEARKLLFTTKKGKSVYYNRALGLKIFPLMVIGLGIIFGISIYTQTLSNLSSAVKISESRIKAIGTSVEKNTKRAETVSEFYNKQYLNKTSLLADIIERAPYIVFDYDMTDTLHYEYAKDSDNKIVTDNYGNPVFTARYHANLQALCAAYDFSSMYIFNDRGRVIATSTQWWNFELSEDPTSQSFAFRDVLVNTDFLVQDYQVNDVGQSEQYIGTAFYYYTYNDNGVTRFASEYDFKNGLITENGRVVTPSEITRHRGLLQTSVAQTSIEDYISMSTVEYTMKGMNMFYGGYFLGFADNEAHTLLYSPFAEGTYIETTEGMFNGEYNGFIRIAGQKYFASIRKAGGMFIGTLIPTDALFMMRNNISLATVIIAFISFVNLLGFMLYSNSDEDAAMQERFNESKRKQQEESEGAITGSVNFDVTMPNGKKKRVRSAQSRWVKSFTEWQQKSVEQKFSTVVKICSYMLFLFVLLSVLFVKVVFPEGSIMNYIISGNLDRSLNLFVVSRSAMILIVVLFGAKIAQRVINVLSSNLGARAETVGNLLESVIEYGGVIGVIFYALHLMGLNTASLLTSAGILSIVVGLGAQSLISDILAGIFIVFEGEFRVGDIVTIGDFRGTVLEIGIRTTKIEDFLGNIKIYNNSSISGVLNMTKEYSTVPITLAIEYGESLERVETVLDEEFPKIKEKLTNIVSGPFYKGVSSLGDNSVNLLVIAQCLEADRIQVTRDLNREIYLAFNRHNINVPFPQVTVSYLKDEKTKTTRKDKKNAENFVTEQKEASVGVDTFKP